MKKAAAEHCSVAAFSKISVKFANFHFEAADGLRSLNFKAVKILAHGYKAQPVVAEAVIQTHGGNVVWHDVHAEAAAALGGASRLEEPYRRFCNTSAAVRHVYIYVVDPTNRAADMSVQKAERTTLITAYDKQTVTVGTAPFSEHIAGVIVGNAVVVNAPEGHDKRYKRRRVFGAEG